MTTPKTPQKSKEITLGNGETYKARMSMLALEIIDEQLGLNMLSPGKDTEKSLDSILKSAKNASIFLHALLVSDQPDLELDTVKRFADLETFKKIPALISSMFGADNKEEKNDEGEDEGNAAKSKP